MEGKERTDSTISPKQWEALKETMRSEEYFSKRNRGLKARVNVRDTFWSRRVAGQKRQICSKCGFFVEFILLFI